MCYQHFNTEKKKILISKKYLFGRIKKNYFFENKILYFQRNKILYFQRNFH